MALLRRLRSTKHPAQVAIMAPFAIISLIGIIGLVVDIGVFRLIDSELENAADAAALAAAWYDPVCPYDPADPINTDPRCAPDNAPGKAADIAVLYGGYNLGLASTLCGSPPVIDKTSGVLIHPIQSPNVNAVTVIVQCRAGYLAGRILGLGSTDITRWATAGIGNEVDVIGSDGTTRANMGDYLASAGSLTPPLIARLVAL